ncbi:type II toxin-antitoxin system CcdA family antitoxin [Glaciimonas sp. GG7]
MDHAVMSKRATNISLPIDVYLATKEMGINISQVCERALREIIRAQKEREWNDQNAGYIKAYNELVETEGVALQEWRSF